MPGVLNGQTFTPLHAMYQCKRENCGALVTSDNTIFRAFNYGRCYCGGELKAVHAPRPTIRQKIVV